MSPSDQNRHEWIAYAFSPPPYPLPQRPLTPLQRAQSYAAEVRQRKGWIVTRLDAKPIWDELAEIGKGIADNISQ